MFTRGGNVTDRITVMHKGLPVNRVCLFGLALLKPHWFSFCEHKLRAFVLPNTMNMTAPIQLKSSLSLSRVWVASFAVALVMASCATKAKFVASTVVPAASGEVRVKKDDNNNYSVKVSVENLTEPDRLPQPKDAYVVWAQTGAGNPQNLGQLRPASGLFGSKLKASLETVTPYKPSRIFITAEDTPRAQYPSAYVVLNTNTF